MQRRMPYRGEDLIKAPRRTPDPEMVDHLTSSVPTEPDQLETELLPAESVECQIKDVSDIPELRKLHKQVVVRRSASAKRGKSPRRMTRRQARLAAKKAAKQSSTVITTTEVIEPSVFVSPKYAVHTFPTMKNHAIVVECQ